MSLPGGLLYILAAILYINFSANIVLAASSSNDKIVEYLSPHQIDITRKTSIHLNGIDIDESMLFDCLEDHEKELIFGTTTRDSGKFKLMHLHNRLQSDIISQDSYTPKKRFKRDAEKAQNYLYTHDKLGPEVSVKIKDNKKMLSFKLHQMPQLIDDAFIFIRRYANSSQFVEDSLKLAQQFENCFYSNGNASLDLCDHESVRGIFRHNSSDFIIHPLPKRFGKSSHIIFETNLQDTLPMKSINDNYYKKFEPDVDEYNTSKILQHPNVNHTNKLKTKLNNSYKPRFHYSRALHKKHNYYKHHVHDHDRFKTHKSQHRSRRYIHQKDSQILYIETAIFVDRDIFEHMTRNYPEHTESHLIRFVFAMINGVQLLYHDPSLGHRINFVLKRVEILYKDPSDLKRSEDIDIYLSNFCKWQQSYNPASDTDTAHYDHALILTGLNLFVVEKSGKRNSNVVGLAPVGGMCQTTSSCTINEGKHFESVFVVAHEIGHNLGMRHDTHENNCDPTRHIMSPNLGSGKTTWSECSRNSLNEFLAKSQARCLFDHDEYSNKLDHTAQGRLPGERFDADQQCMLKYGKQASRSVRQKRSEICQDLHCKRERFTWTSHPALEGTKCGDNMWCRRGGCTSKDDFAKEYSTSASKQIPSYGKVTKENGNFLPTTKSEHLLSDYNFKSQGWSDWGTASPCESGCLYGPSKRLREGSTGLRTFTRRCLDFRHRCTGQDRKYESCVAKQCYSIAITTIEQFATQICEKAQTFDSELTGRGMQVIGDIEESCKIVCRTKMNGTKSRSWTFPDGTTCRAKHFNQNDVAYCIGGRCEKFLCDNSTVNYFKIDQKFCHYEVQPTIAVAENRQSNVYNNKRYAERSSTYNNGNAIGSTSYYRHSTARSKYENEVALRSFHSSSHEYPQKRKSDINQSWNKYNYHYTNNQVHSTIATVPPENNWIVKSGCHTSCVANSKGVQVVMSQRTGENNIQLCSHAIQEPCERLLTAIEYAEQTCARYKLKVRGLSGHGTQIASNMEEPDRSCRVGCQDEFIKYRFYLVNGKFGHFPLGTKCSQNSERYCVNGKCLEFGPDNIPLQQSHISLALFRNRRSLNQNFVQKRHKRSYLHFIPVNITETISQDFINNLVNSIMDIENKYLAMDEFNAEDHIEFKRPIYISSDDMN